MLSVTFGQAFSSALTFKICLVFSLVYGANEEEISQKSKVDQLITLFPQSKVPWGSLEGVLHGISVKQECDLNTQS